MDRSRSRAALTVAALVASLLLPGCGGDPDPDASRLGESRDYGGPADAAPREESEGRDGGMTAANFMTQVLAAQEQAGSYRTTSTTTVGPARIVLEGEVEYVDGSLVGSVVSTNESAAPMESVVAEGIVYLRTATLPIPEGKWLAVDSLDPANAATIGQLAAYADQQRALESVGTLESLERVGRARIDGVATTHFRAEASVGTFAETLDLSDEDVAMLPPSIPLEVWLDSARRIVQLTFDYEIGGVRASSVQRYFDYGAPIDVTVPTTADTVTPAEIGLS